MSRLMRAPASQIVMADQKRRVEQATRFSRRPADRAAHQRFPR